MLVRTSPFENVGENCEEVAPFIEFVIQERHKTYDAMVASQHLARNVVPLAQLALCSDYSPDNVPKVIIELAIHATNAERQRVKLELLDTIYPDCAAGVSESNLDFAGKNEVAFYAIWQMYVEALVTQGMQVKA